jgi:hypothetical protein
MLPSDELGYAKRTKGPGWLPEVNAQLHICHDWSRKRRRLLMTEATALPSLWE